ncbi:MAG: Smr/MutS family protein [Candidatus Latescibacteria bacterium]|nr:Smr/MutS family protein [Candidatus Latescibacterota bacterium]
MADLEAEEGDPLDPVEVPIDGELDLHTFRPGEIGELIPDYLEACRQRGILRVRLVHGKGSGALRRGVHAVLERLPQVSSFRQGDAGEGGWGATVVFLAGGGK